MVSIVIEMKGDLDMVATFPGKVLRKNTQETEVCIRERHFTFRTEDIICRVVKEDAQPIRTKKCECEPEQNECVDVPLNILSKNLVHSHI